MFKFFLHIFKKYISKYISNKIKVILSQKIVNILFKIRIVFHIYKFDRFLIQLCFKAIDFDKIKKIVAAHKHDVEYCRSLERISRYEALGDNFYKKPFEIDRMFTFQADKYQQLLKINKQLLQDFPNDFLLHDRIAKNYIAGGYVEKAKFHIFQSLKIQRKVKLSEGKTGLIIIASLTRSGGQYTADNLRKGLGIKLAEISYTSFGSTDFFALPQFAYNWAFTPMPDALWMGHVPAWKNNLLNLSLITDKLVVNFRDPRQHLVSFAHHLRWLRLKGKMTGLIQIHIPDEYFLWSFEKQLDWQIENSIVPFSIDWINGWLEAEKNPEFPCEIFYSQQLLLNRNEKKHFQNILSFYGLSEEKFIFPPKAKFDEATNQRKGSSDEWKDVLTSIQIQKINKLIPETWFQKFDWEEK